MTKTILKGPTLWLAAALIAAAFAVVKLDLFGAGAFIHSNGRWAAGIGLGVFAVIVAISLHALGRKPGDDSSN